MQIRIPEQYSNYKGEVEFIIKDRNGQVIEHRVYPNIVKIHAKEMLAHRLPHTKIWDPTGGTGSGAWVASNIDPNSDMAAKYILLGASFDENGAALDTNDTRYYTLDNVTNGYIPVALGPGAEFEGGLINAVPLSEPDRPLKRVERVYFEPTYQPAGTPLLQDDVRAINNRVVFETTLLKDEYNGFGLTSSDYFTITEVALAGGIELDSIGACECDPKSLFLEGNSGVAIPATATGSSTIILDTAATGLLDLINEGDQVKIVDLNDTGDATNSVDQTTPYYLVISKSASGSDITLDRAPSDSDGNYVTGSIGVFRSSLRIFSHRILSSPVKKSNDVEVTIRWSIIMN